MRWKFVCEMKLHLTSHDRLRMFWLPLHLFTRLYIMSGRTASEVTQHTIWCVNQTQFRGNYNWAQNNFFS